MAKNNGGPRRQRSVRLQLGPRQRALESLLTPGTSTVGEAAARAGVSERQVGRWLRDKVFSDRIRRKAQEDLKRVQRSGLDSGTWEKVLASTRRAGKELPEAAALYRSVDWSDPIDTFNVGFTLGRAYELGLKYPSASKAGPPAAQQRRTEHEETKVKPYREEYRRRLQDGEPSKGIIDDLAQRYGYKPRRMREIIRPRSIRTGLSIT